MDKSEKKKTMKMVAIVVALVIALLVVVALSLIFHADGALAGVLHGMAGFSQWQKGSAKQYLYVDIEKKVSGLVSSLPAKPSSKTSRLVCLSDVHTLWDYIDVPPGDTLLITGDITLTDKSAEGFLTKFQTFLEKQKETFKDIFVIAGNHDQIIQRLGKAEVQKRLKPAIYLENDLAVSSGNLTLFGSPWSAPEMKNHIAFQFFDPTEEKKFLKPLEELNPGSVDVLMTHGGGNHPSDLTPIVQRLKPRVGLSGHYHSEYGVQFVGETVFINCASVNVLYRPVNPVVVVDIEPRPIK